ncbi:MAG: tRNA glutamyl-Q(34) synthetase GluQRS [Caulobacteraceae bacterium]
MPNPPFATRFAPSPTGLLHRGHAVSALCGFEAARAVGGRFLIRIEDLDETRVRPEFETAIFEDLAWLGLSWETPVRRQSEHRDDYRGALSTLCAQGLLYRCFKTRRELMEASASAPHGSDPSPYRGDPLPEAEETARLARGEPFAWRLSLEGAKAALGPAWSDLSFHEEGAGPAGETGRIAAEPERLGDVILARKDVGAAYHLAVVVDDALQGITHVIRGTDLFEAAHIQRLIQALLGLPTPTYRHHHLLIDETGQRLAKRRGGETLRDLRASGAGPEDVRRELGF